MVFIFLFAGIVYILSKQSFFFFVLFYYYHLKSATDANDKRMSSLLQ